MANHTTGAQRYNARMEKIWEEARKNGAIADNNWETARKARTGKHEMMKGVGTARGIRIALSRYAAQPDMIGYINDEAHVDTRGAKRYDRRYKRFAGITN